MTASTARDEHKSVIEALQVFFSQDRVFVVHFRQNEQLTRELCDCLAGCSTNDDITYVNAKTRHFVAHEQLAPIVTIR